MCTSDREAPPASATPETPASDAMKSARHHATTARTESEDVAQCSLWKPFRQAMDTTVKCMCHKRVPQLSQMSTVECGLTCLAMILSYYGRRTSVSELRTECGGGRDGLSALRLVNAARNYGLKVRALSLQQCDLSTLPLPAIVHWEFNHFLVVEHWLRKWVRVVDPAGGRRKLTTGEFDSGFTGVIILLAPGMQFQRRKATTRALLRQYLRQYVRLAPIALIQVVGISFLIQALGLLLPLATRFIVDQVLPFKMNNVIVILGVGWALSHWRRL